MQTLLQQTFKGQVRFPAAANGPQSANALQFEVHVPPEDTGVQKLGPNLRRVSDVLYLDVEHMRPTRRSQILSCSRHHWHME